MSQLVGGWWLVVGARPSRNHTALCQTGAGKTFTMFGPEKVEANTHCDNFSDYCVVIGQ